MEDVRRLPVGEGSEGIRVSLDELAREYLALACGQCFEERVFAPGELDLFAGSLDDVGASVDL